MKKLTQEYVRSILYYNPKTGEFFWKVRSDVRKEWNTRHAGKKTGHHGSPYCTLRINDCAYKAHRIAWLYIHGAMPFEIDHIDMDTKNNRISNLREVTKSQNQWGKSIQKNNTSGYKGVCYNKRNQSWQAGIKINGKNKALGQYKTPEAAHAAYCKASAELRGEYGRTA